jgi:hypothetical protein
MKSFQDSIEQLLWPEKREKDSVLGDKVPGKIDRTTTMSYLRVPVGYLPDLLQPLFDPARRAVPEALERDRHRDRADPRGHADQPARERGRDAGARRERGRQGRARREGGGARRQDQEGPDSCCRATRPTTRRRPRSRTSWSRC